MVLLMIRAPIFALIVTIISVIAELAFLTAALHLLTYASYRSLKDKTRFLKIRSHMLKVYAITVLAMIMFVSIESVISVFSDVSVEKVRSVEPCFRIGAPASTPSVSMNVVKGRAIYFRCVKVQGSLVTHMVGNSTTDSTTIACSTDEGYSYRIGKDRNISRTEQMIISCNSNELCATSLLDGDTLYFSAPGVRQSTRVGEKVRMMPTNVSMLNKERIDTAVITQRLLQIYENANHMEGEVRRRLLLETTRSTCQFEREGRQATEVRGFVLIAAAAVWTLSLLLLPVALALKRRSLFDVNDPLHWAKFAWHDPERAVGKQPLLQQLDDGTGCRMCIVHYARE